MKRRSDNRRARQDEIDDSTETDYGPEDAPRRTSQPPPSSIRTASVPQPAIPRGRENRSANNPETGI